MTTGTIKRLNERQFGFIGREGGDDVFFHASALIDTTFDNLREGEKVEFDLERDPRGKGDRAANVRRVSS
ncbi:MAG: cold shock domain-containing protein [Chloroflexota bacterium]|nr:cold shock domain-containing protein [Chloroflexota bacterium]